MVQSIHLTGRVISSSAYLFSLKQTINAGLMTYKAISENFTITSRQVNYRQPGYRLQIFNRCGAGTFFTIGKNK